MPTFYLAQLNPGAETLNAAGTFSGRITVQPTTNSTATNGTAITAANIQPYFKFYTNPTVNEQDVDFTNSGDLITWKVGGSAAAHGLTENQAIVFSSVSTANGITVGTTYYIRANPGTNTFEISTSVGGAIHAISADSTGTIQEVLISGVSGLDATANYAATTNNLFTLSTHGLINDQTVTFTALGDAVGTGLAINTTYHVIDKTDDTFKIAATTGGTEIDITILGTCVGGRNGDTFIFVGDATAKSEFVSLLATEVFGSSEASDLFSNIAAIETSHEAACTTATDSLRTLVLTAGADASTELVNAMFLPKDVSQRFTLPYKAVTASGTIASGNDLALTGGGSGANAKVDIEVLAATIVSGTAAITITGHGLSVSDTISFTDTASNTTFDAGTQYFVLTSADANTITISATDGGTVITPDASGDGQIIQTITLSTNPVSFTEATELVTIASGHPFVNASRIVFTSINTTTGITVDTAYTVRDKTATTFKVGTLLTPVGVASTDVFTSATHGFADADTITFSSIGGGAGFAVDTTYYIRDKTADTFYISNLVTYDAAVDDFFTENSHGHVNGDKIIFTSIGDAVGTDAAAAAFAINTTYYVVDKTDNTFKISHASGGTEVTITTAGTCSGIGPKINITTDTADSGGVTSSNGPVLPLGTGDGNGILTRYGSGYAKGETATITNSGATLTILLNSVQAAMLNGTLNNVGTPTEVPIEATDKIRVKYTITSKSDQADTSGETVTATQTFFTDFTVSA